MNEFKVILETYDNYLRRDLPTEINCLVQNDEDIKKTFMRFKPKIFKISKVQHKHRRDGCYYAVYYYLADGSNLPTGPGLKPLVNILKRFYPINSIIVEDEIILPREIVLTYAVYCSCVKLNFEEPVPTSHAQAIETLCSHMQTYLF